MEKRHDVTPCDMLNGRRARKLDGKEWQMGSEEEHRNWSVFDGVKTVVPSTPESLIAEINTSISNLEYARATVFLDSASSSARNKSSSNPGNHQYDTRMADEAFKAGCAALAAGRFEEALQSLNLSLAKCPPDRTSAVSKLQSLISHVSLQLRRSCKNVVM